jgi:hypothetical protein
MNSLEKYLSRLEDFKKLQEEMTEDKAVKRKNTPVFSGCLSYFPLALKEVSKVSKQGNDQHHPDKPLHWDRNKSNDELDALTRHLLDHSVNPVDDDGQLQIAKVAWRALAYLEKYLENK